MYYFIARNQVPIRNLIDFETVGFMKISPTLLNAETQNCYMSYVCMYFCVYFYGIHIRLYVCSIMHVNTTYVYSVSMVSV